MEQHKNISEQELDLLLDDALGSESDFILPADFAEQLSARLSTQILWRQSMQEFFLYLAAFLAIAGIAVATLFWMDTAIWYQITSFFKQQYSLIIGIHILLIFVLFTDRVLLRYFHFRLNEKRYYS
ncbi:MAG: hypothetical protein K9H64_14855 [Bacteroidales bacterium]|nr:hypothetical protein [Bacteroidales bacterium]MCF8457245.1 hypothetical protein [Bacteroidales bacterium]